MKKIDCLTSTKLPLRTIIDEVKIPQQMHIHALQHITNAIDISIHKPSPPRLSIDAEDVDRVVHRQFTQRRECAARAHARDVAGVLQHIRVPAHLRVRE